MKDKSKKVSSCDTNVEHKKMTDLLKGKIVCKITKVDCDEGAVIHFTDGTKLEFGYAGLAGDTSINGIKMDVDGF